MTAMTDTEFQAIVMEYREMKAMADDVAAAVNMIADKIKAEMDERQVDLLRAGIFTVRWKRITSMSLDTKALKAAYPDLAAQYSIETVSRRFTVA
jgi:predicted phage-related endonuclease